MEVKTRESYTYLLNRHILPWFGPMRMVEILPAQVREWITHLGERGLAPATIQKLRFVVSAIFTTALNDQVTFLHACKELNAAGRRYRHGTLSGYGPGGCRCRPCKDAIAIYRSSRRNAGKDRPSVGRPVGTDGHIPNGWFREQVWKPACKAAGLGEKVRPHDMRHAHASWLLAGGADLQVVKERLGHGSIKTTERYLHTLPDQDETAVDAFMAVRHRGPR